MSRAIFFRSKELMHDKRYGERRGYTITELMIVVVIIAILAAIVLPRFIGHDEKAMAMEAVNIIGQTHALLDAYHDARGVYPVCADLAAIETALATTFPAPKYGWTFATDVNGLITATRAGSTLTMTADGVYGGTGDYDPVTGRYWPNLV